MADYVAQMRQLVGSRPLLLAAAGVIVERADREILLQRRSDDALWGIPGGSLELGESLEDAARRELTEETGLVAGELSLLDVYSGPDFFLEYPNGDQAYVVGATFLATNVYGELVEPDGKESTELRFFPTSQLPGAMSRFHRRVLHRCGYVLDADRRA